MSRDLSVSIFNITILLHLAYTLDTSIEVKVQRSIRRTLKSSFSSLALNVGSIMAASRFMCRYVRAIDASIMFSLPQADLMPPIMSCV